MVVRTLAIILSVSLASGTVVAKPSSTVSSKDSGTTTNTNTKSSAKATEGTVSMEQKNIEEGKKFFETNKTKPGVITLPSGLQYKVIKAGSGKSPTLHGFVTVHYRGTLLDGTEFDSSLKRKVPASFEVNKVIPGWTEALQLMKPGAEWVIYIPSNLAYGKQGVKGVIPANSALIFDVQLISVGQPPQDNDSEVQPALEEKD